MKHSELVKQFIDSKINSSGLIVASCHKSSGYYFIKVTHTSGRQCYTWSKIPPVSCKIRELRSIKPRDKSDALVMGGYSTITPSCDGVVGEYTNKIEILTMVDANVASPNRITLSDALNTSPVKAPLIYPLVSVENLSKRTWKNRYDDLNRSLVNDLTLTIKRRVEYFSKVQKLLEMNIKNVTNDMVSINNNIATENAETKSSVSNMQLIIKTLREIENLSCSIAPLHKMLELRV